MNNPKTWHPHPRIYKKSPHTADAPDAQPVEGETLPRRNIVSKDGLIMRPEEGVATVYDIVRRSAKQFGNAKAAGYRKLIKMHNDTKKIKKMVDGKEQEQDKTWQFFELSEYHYFTFLEYEKLMLQLGSGLRKLGMEPGDKLHLFAATRYELALLVNLFALY